MKILFKNIRTVDAQKDVKTSVLAGKNGKIEALGDYKELNIDKDTEIIDGGNYVLMPSFADLHAHFREPGYEYKEDLNSGSHAAVRGGYTFVNLMANTKPVCSSMETVDYVLDKIKKIGLINAHQCVSVTKNFDGENLSHLKDIDSEKVRFISDDGRGVVNNLTSYKSMLIAKEKDFVIMTHAEDMELTPIDYRISENIITFRDLYLCAVTGARLHLSHVSTKEALSAIRLAKRNGVNVTCEVTPHHIALYDMDFKVNPPIRTKEDVLAVTQALQDGTADCISTDHAPHSKEDKQNGSPGLPGLETAFAVCYTELVRGRKLSLSRLSELMSLNPYKIIGKRAGKRGLVLPGYEADLVLAGIETPYIIHGEDFAGKGRITPFENKKVYGKILMTFKSGKAVYIDNRQAL